MESLDVNGFVGSLKKSKTQPKRIAEINEIANRAWADVGLLKVDSNLPYTLCRPNIGTK